MLCQKCGYYSEQDDNVCPECGALLQNESLHMSEGVRAIRQGKRAREAYVKKNSETEQFASIQRGIPAASSDGISMPVVRDTRTDPSEEEDGYPESENEAAENNQVFERRRRNFYDNEADETIAEKYIPVYAGGARVPHMVNWVKIAFFAVLALMILLAGSWLFLKKTDIGQRLMARFGFEANSVAYWAVGDEKMNSGDIDGAIECFEKARNMDAKEAVVDVDGLLMLGSALEAAGRTEEAAALYQEIYESTPSRSEAYINHIRILQSSGNSKDLVLAGELMKTAYEKTGEKTFLTQRDDLLPSPPGVKPDAGNYYTKKTIVLSSFQGFDVYYTFDPEAVLPDKGIKAKPEGIMLDEGIWNLRAVCVNGDLISDELKGTYKIIMPSPMTPRATLAPNTYKKSQRVSLKPGIDDEKDTSIVIYYTIDGSIPDSDSPIFDGEPIRLPNGWVTLKAYAVNRYRKLSNMLEVKYKIEANPKPKSAFSQEDLIDELKMFKTTQSEFFSVYGEGTAAGSVLIEGFDNECRRFDYPWGYVMMTLSKKNWVLTEVSFKSAGKLSGPRGTQIGDTEEYVVDKFRDMMQVESKSGNRGLYAMDNGSTGKIWLQEDGKKIIRYRYPTESHWVQLEYLVDRAGKVMNICMKYIP